VGWLYHFYIADIIDSKLEIPSNGEMYNPPHLGEALDLSVNEVAKRIAV